MIEVKEMKLKKTEIGKIPEDWDSIILFELTNKIGSGITPRGGSKIYQSSGIPFIRSQNIGRGFLKLKNVAFISDEIHATFKSTEIDVDDVFLNITGASIGRSAIANKKVKGGNVNQHVCIIRPKMDLLNPKFLNAVLLSSIGQKQIDSYQSGGNREGLNFSQIQKLIIPIPPTLKEQHAIAIALSNMDELLQSLDQLIAKKRAIKQGTMQQLLTPPQEGGKGLKGFSGDWDIVELGKNSKLKARIGWQGLTTAEYKKQGDYLLVTGTDFKNGSVDWKNCFYVEEERYRQDKNIQIQKGDVLVTKDGTIGKVAFVKDVPKPATLNSGVFVIRPINDAYSSAYLYYILRSRHFKTFLAQLTAGSTILHIYQKDFIHFKFPLPPTKEEQTAIAQILIDMDTEIESLEGQRKKYQSIKQGMMQELLTGKTRLI